MVATSNNYNGMAVSWVSRVGLGLRGTVVLCSLAVPACINGKRCSMKNLPNTEDGEMQ